MYRNARLPTQLLIASLALTAALAAHGQQYRWVDEKGRVQYRDTPPPPGAKNVQKKNLNAGPTADAGEPYSLQIAIRKAPIKLYTAPDCGGFCDDARKLLNQRGIPFSEISVTSAEQAEALKGLSGGTGVPVMLVGGSVQKGFEASSYHRALDAAGYPVPGVLKPRHQEAPPPPKPPAQVADMPAQGSASPTPPSTDARKQ